MKKTVKVLLVLAACFIGIQANMFGLPDDDALFNAVRNNRENEALGIISRIRYNNNADPNYAKYELNVKKSVLTLAIENKNLKVVEALIEAGARTDFAGIRTETPLMVAVRANAPDIVRYLVRGASDLNVQDQNGNTALHCAAGVYGRSSVPILTILMQNSARDSSYMCNDNGETPFIVAIREGNSDVVSFFLSYDRFDVAKADSLRIPPVLAAIRAGIFLKDLDFMLQKTPLAPKQIMDPQTHDAYWYVLTYKNNNAEYLEILNKHQDNKGGRR